MFMKMLNIQSPWWGLHRNGGNLFQFNTQLSSDIYRFLVLETEFFQKVQRKKN